MPLQPADLDRIDQVKYLAAENWEEYRVIMRILYLENEKMHYQLMRDDILELMHRVPGYADYDPDKLNAALSQLSRWQNLTQIQDPHIQYTIADFKNQRFQYMLTPESVEIERMTITLENLRTKTDSLSMNAFRRIRAALDRARQLDSMTSAEIVDWWNDLEEDFNRMNQSHQDYLREFYDPTSSRAVDPEEFVVYKRRLVQYLEDFIVNLQHSVDQIGSRLESFTPEETEHILDLVFRSSLETVRANPSQTQEREAELQTRQRDLWNALYRWFVGRDSNARQVMDVTNEVIRMVVQQAALLLQMQSSGTGNSAELRHMMELFAGCGSIDEAHRLSAMVFGSQGVRNVTANAVRVTDQTDSSAYDEPPMEFQLKPRTRVYRPRVDRTGFRDRSAEKAAEKKRVLAEARQLEADVKRFVRGGRLEFGKLEEPVPPRVREVFLSWISMACLNANRKGRTEYGQSFTLKRRSRGTCHMVCTDGVLTMPDFVLVFEEVKGNG